MLKRCSLIESCLVSSETHHGRRQRPLDEERFEIPHTPVETLEFRGVNGQLVFCLSECNTLLAALGLLILALLLSMSLNIIFCMRQRGALFKGTALKRWMFLKNANRFCKSLYIVHTDKCCLSARERYAFYFYFLILFESHFWKFFAFLNDSAVRPVVKSLLSVSLKRVAG